MSKEQKIKKENPNPTFFTEKAKIRKSTGCNKLIYQVNKKLENKRKSKFNTLNHCDSKQKKCNCGDESGNPKGQKTDLIVLIDTSSSMGSSAMAVSDAVKKAVEEAKKSCEPDLRLIFLGVDGTWNGTNFNQSHRNYLTGLHGTGISLAADRNHVGLISEQGANAIEDLAKFADWREEACRAIFYISDEELDSSRPRNDFANETAVTNAAIAEANSNNVTVFAHHLTHLKLVPQIIQNYIDLCQNTGGKAYFSNVPDEKEYVNLLTEVICNSCGISNCKEIELPEIKPCISIQWGDSECDCLESDDYEIMYLTICNCFSNVTFKDFTIGCLEVCHENGDPIDILPDGTPSVQLVPIGPYCFGDIEPCTCSSREFTLILRGARSGKYKIKMSGICYSVCFHFDYEDCFEFDICKD